MQKKTSAQIKKFSAAAKKAWKTRRANAEKVKRSEAARKAWATRRGETYSAS